MRIEFVPNDPRSHRLRVSRAPHPSIDVVLESRSFLLHDLTHYAVETALNTEHGFWGLLASGHDPLTLRSPEAMNDAEAHARLMQIEGQVVLLQTAFKKDPSAARQKLGGNNLRRLMGAWRKTGPSEMLTLTWPHPEPSVASR